jgi:hypothetical protein
LKRSRSRWNISGSALESGSGCNCRLRSVKCSNIFSGKRLIKFQWMFPNF